MKSPFQAAALLLAAALAAAAAEPHWIKAKFGPFEAISDDGRKPALQALSQFVQFSFALGTVMGQPDLKLEPCCASSSFATIGNSTRNAHRLCTRDAIGSMACTTAEGQLPPALVRDLTRTLLQTTSGTCRPE